MIETERINVAVTEFVGVIRLARPERANALDGEMIKQLTETLNQWKKRDCRLLVLGGRGKHFCAGFDLKSFLLGKKERKRTLTALGDLFGSLANFPAPSIAMVQGSVAAGGLVLAACCDFAYAQEKTTFSLTETKVGFASGMTYPFLLRRMNLNLLNRLILLREVVEAPVMHEQGFLTGVIPKEGLCATLSKVINHVLEGDARAQREFKRFIGKHSYYRFPQAKEWAAAHKVLWETSNRKVVQRRIEGFLSKAKPDITPKPPRLPSSWSWESPH